MTAPKHAMVIRDGFSVPLIGIPPAAVLETCDLCGDEFPVLEVELSHGQMLCRRCRASDSPAVYQPPTINHQPPQ